MSRVRALISFGAGAAVFTAASLGLFRSVELFPWIFGFAWPTASAWMGRSGSSRWRIN